LLAWRRTLPFHHLALDQLETVRLHMVEERFGESRQFWMAGQELDRAYVVLEGQLEQIFHGGVELAGQMPARSTLVSQGPVRLLRLSAQHWERAVVEIPALAIGTFQWLSGELRRSEKVAS